MAIALSDTLIFSKPSVSSEDGDDKVTSASDDNMVQTSSISAEHQPANEAVDQGDDHTEDSTVSSLAKGSPEAEEEGGEAAEASSCSTAPPEKASTEHTTTTSTEPAAADDNSSKAVNGDSSVSSRLTAASEDNSSSPSASPTPNKLESPAGTPRKAEDCPMSDEPAAKRLKLSSDSTAAAAAVSTGEAAAAATESETTTNHQPGTRT